MQWKLSQKKKCKLIKFLWISNQNKILKVRNMKFSIKDFFSKCDQIRSFLRI